MTTFKQIPSELIFPAIRERKKDPQLKFSNPIGRHAFLMYLKPVSNVIYPVIDILNDYYIKKNS